jgi:hypothetical protein
LTFIINRSLQKRRNVHTISQLRSNYMGTSYRKVFSASSQTRVHRRRCLTNRDKVCHWAI